MRRALPALIATFGGLVLLLNFRTAAGVKPRSIAAPTTSTAPAAGSSPPPSGTSAPTTSGTGTGTQQVDGPVITTQFGDVQVRVVLTNGRITDVKPLQMPFDRQHSQEITQAVTPLLHDEVLQAQSARIDLFSGATYTSDAYQQSLQAALAKVGK
jgi:uncharacterized protein with FMN-binding domain